MCVHHKPFVAHGICVTPIAEYSSTSCGVQGTGGMPPPHPKASDYPRSEPGYFSNITSNFGPEAIVHTVNYSTWCYDEEDLIDLLQLDMVQETADDSSPPTWVPVWISICACLLTDRFFDSCYYLSFYGKNARRRFLESLTDLMALSSPPGA